MVLSGTPRPWSHKNPGVNLAQPPFPPRPVAESLGLRPFEKGPEIPTWGWAGKAAMQSNTQLGPDRPPAIAGDHYDCGPHGSGKQGLSSACAPCPQNSGNLLENLGTNMSLQKV